MRRIRPLAVLLLVASLCLPVWSESAKSLYNKGRSAEDRQDYMAAFEQYRQAYEQDPKEMRYRIAYQRTRFLASAAHVNKGQDLREAGNLTEALTEFEYAKKIDPSSFIADQEIRRTRAMIEGGQQGNPSANPPGPTVSKKLQEAATPAELAPVSNQPITLKIANDSKVIYETIGKLAGINVLFDPDYTSRRIPLELNGVSLEEALDIVAFQSRTFWRPITPNTIFVSADTPAKRKDLEQGVLKTFYLSNVTAQTDIQDIVNTLRTVLELQKVQPLASQQAIVVRGTPDQLALAEKIISDIDKPRSEVVVEVAVMQVRRDRLRELGILPPTSASVSLTGPTTTTSTPTTTGTGTTGTTTGTPTGTTTTGNLTINTLANLKATDFAVTIPSASVSALFNDNSSKLIQNPQIRATDGQKASLKIGDRVPVATGSFNNGISGALGGFGGINTQFQYLDVGVNIDITPTVHAGREVTLKLVLDVSSVTGSSDIGGIKQPIISQRKVEHQIRLREGEVNLLGGIFESSEIKTISGIPGLGQLPFLKYLFSQDHTERIDSEIVFILVPHIVRSQELTDINLRSIDVGTSTGTPTIRRMTKPVQGATPAPQSPVPMSSVRPTSATTTTAANAAAGNVAAPSGNTSTAMTGPSPNSTNYSTPGAPQPPTPGPGPSQGNATPSAGATGATSPAVQGAIAAQNPPTANNGATATPGNANQPVATLRFEPSTSNVSVGNTFSVTVQSAGLQDVYSAPMQISYDPRTLQLVNVSNGDLLSRDGQPVALVHREDQQTGTIQVNATRPPGAGGVSGDGALYVLTFRAKAVGDSNISITRPSARNSAMQAIPLTTSTAAVSVR